MSDIFQYELHLERNITLLPFDDSTNRGGRFSLTSSSSIIIGKEGEINASGCGLLRNSKYVNESVVKLGRFSSGAWNEMRDIANAGAGGGIIALCSVGNIVNCGKLLSNSSVSNALGGGTLLISTDGKFENDGYLSCEEGGNIRILCRQLVNHGFIATPPTIQILDGLKTGSYVAAVCGTEKGAIMDSAFTTDLIDIGGHWIWKRFEDEFWVDILFSILKARSTKITSAETFWKNFGVHSKSQWIRMILNKGRETLFEKTAYQNTLIIQRLVDELKLDAGWRQVIWSMGERMSRNVLEHRGHFLSWHPRYLLKA